MIIREELDGTALGGPVALAAMESRMIIREEGDVDGLQDAHGGGAAMESRMIIREEIVGILTAGYDKEEPQWSPG